MFADDKESIEAAGLAVHEESQTSATGMNDDTEVRAFGGRVEARQRTNMTFHM